MSKMNSSVVHIVYAADDKFAEILGVSLVSLYENNQDMEKIIVYILDSGIVEEKKQKLLAICRNYRRNPVIFIQGENVSERLSINVSIDRGSLSQYARLFVSSVLPADLDRVLYLDCDVIINRSIYELWNLDLQEKTIGALMDAFSGYYRANIGLDENDIMFNSGVMLIDLQKWREQKIEEELLKFIIFKHGKIQQGDQGVLNAVLSHNVYCFEPKMNSVTIFYDFTYKEILIYRRPPQFYAEEQISEAVKNPLIIHFTTSFLSKRPWVKGCKHKCVEQWLKYKSMSPWKDVSLWEDNSPKWKQTGAKVITMMPRSFGIRFAGVIQVYGRPLINRIMK